jgi:hypothetical protein
VSRTVVVQFGQISIAALQVRRNINPSLHNASTMRQPEITAEQEASCRHGLSAAIYSKARRMRPGTSMLI